MIKDMVTGWWTNDKVGYYEATGRGRQTISVIPSKNMVVTMLGGEFDVGTIGKYIFQSIRSDKALPESKNGFSALKKTMKKVAEEPSSQPSLVNSNVLQKLNKRTIAFEKNIVEIDSLRFDFVSKEKGMVTFYKHKSKENYPFVLSTNTYALGFDSTLQLPVALQASFTNQNEFILHFNQLCRINDLSSHLS